MMHNEGNRSCPNGQFKWRKFRKPTRLNRSLLDPAGKVALRKIEEVGQAATVGQSAIHLVLVPNVCKKLFHRNDPMRLLFPHAERCAHHLQKFL